MQSKILKLELIGALFLLLLFFAFVIFTFYPPHNFLFQDPITLKYGI